MLRNRRLSRYFALIIIASSTSWGIPRGGDRWPFEWCFVVIIGGRCALPLSVTHILYECARNHGHWRWRIVQQWTYVQFEQLVLVYESCCEETIRLETGEVYSFLFSTTFVFFTCFKAQKVTEQWTLFSGLRCNYVLSFLMLFK